MDAIWIFWGLTLMRVLVLRYSNRFGAYPASMWYFDLLSAHSARDQVEEHAPNRYATDQIASAFRHASASVPWRRTELFRGLSYMGFALVIIVLVSTPLSPALKFAIGLTAWLSLAAWLQWLGTRLIKQVMEELATATRT